MITKNFIEYFFPGALFADSAMVDVPSRDVAEAKANAPAHAYAFRFITRGRHENELDSRVIDRSGMHYIGGTIYTVDDVKALPGKNDILLANMQCNGWDKVIRTPLGNFQPFTATDKRV